MYCNRSDLLDQYYSTWMGCYDGLTPEPPIHITFSTERSATVTAGNNTSNKTGDNLENWEESNLTTKWRPTLFTDNPHPIRSVSHEDDGIFAVTVISALMVITVASVLITIIVFMFVFTKKEDKE